VAAAVARPAVAHSLDSVAIVWHTGGTTGVPKGCYHTQRRYLLAGRSYGAATGVGPGQRWAAAAPIGHALGMLHHTIFTLLHGTTIVMIEKFADPLNSLEAINRHGVTTFTAIASSWAGMAAVLDRGEAPEPTTLTTGYAMWQSSSSSEVADRWRARGITLLNNFGSTAFATWVLIPRPGEVVPQGALGSVAPGYEVRTIDRESGEMLPAGSIGQMAVRGPSGLTYWRLPEKQRADVRGGWIYVDDLVQEIDGVYSYLGRTDFLISTAGHKVAPSEVENTLARHPAVAEVVVVGLPDAIRQEVVAAFVVIESGIEASDELKRELQTLVKTELSPYKYPRILEFLPALPRDHVGKVQPKIVREQALNNRTKGQ
jgi:2-aminobenzoate-CoA ligase